MTSDSSSATQGLHVPGGGGTAGAAARQWAAAAEFGGWRRLGTAHQLLLVTRLHETARSRVQMSRVRHSSVPARPFLPSLGWSPFLGRCRRRAAGDSRRRGRSRDRGGPRRPWTPRPAAAGSPRPGGPSARHVDRSVGDALARSAAARARRARSRRPSPGPRVTTRARAAATACTAKGTSVSQPAQVAAALAQRASARARTMGVRAAAQEARATRSARSAAGSTAGARSSEVTSRQARRSARHSAHPAGGTRPPPPPRVESPFQIVREELGHVVAAQWAHRRPSSARRAPIRRFASSRRPRLMRLFTVPRGICSVAAASS